MGADSLIQTWLYVRDLAYKGLMMPKKRPDPAKPSGEGLASALQARFGRNFRLFRKRAGLTQEEVSQQSGIHRKEISQVELGKVNLTLVTMQRLATVVDHDVTSLLGDAPETPPKK